MNSIRIVPGWKSFRLNDLLSEPLINGRSVVTRDDGFPVLRLTAIKPNGVDIAERKGGDWSEDQAKPFLISEGDFLISRGSGSLDRVGRGALVPRSPIAVAFPDTIIRARVHSDVLSTAYLSRIWDSPIVRDQITRSVRTTSGIYKVNQYALGEVRLPVPPLLEQLRIAQVLDSVDVLRVKRREAITLLDDFAQSIFLDTFGDPATNLRRWEVESLGDLARVIRGASPRPKGDPKYFGGPIPWLMISDVTRSLGDTVTEIREGVTAAGRDKSVYLKAGTLILTNSATVGLSKFLGVDACIHDGFLAILDISHKVDPMYLYQLFKQNREKISSLAPEGTQKNLNTGIAKALLIPVPPLAVQHVFRRSIEQTNLIRSAHQNHLAELDALFASLQHRAFHGNLWDASAA